MATPKQQAIAQIGIAQLRLIEAADILMAQNKLVRATPEYQELQQTITKLHNLSRAIGKLDL